MYEVNGFFIHFNVKERYPEVTQNLGLFKFPGCGRDLGGLGPKLLKLDPK